MGKRKKDDCVEHEVKHIPPPPVSRRADPATGIVSLYEPSHFESYDNHRGHMGLVETPRIVRLTVDAKTARGLAIELSGLATDLENADRAANPGHAYIVLPTAPC